MAKTKLDPNQIFASVAPKQKNYSAEEVKAQPKADEVIIISVAVPRSLKTELDRRVFEEKAEGRKSSVSDVVRRACASYLSN